jgi:hypothetical protein
MGESSSPAGALRGADQLDLHLAASSFKRLPE